MVEEAVQVRETAGALLGGRISTAQLLELARDARLELRAAGGTAGGASAELDQLVARLEKAARDLRLALGDAGTRLGWSQATRLPGFPEALEKLSLALGPLAEPLAAQAERSAGLASCERRASAARAIPARLSGQQGNEEG